MLLICSPSVARTDVHECSFYETLGEWCRLRDLNSRPTDYKSVALPTELKRQHGHIYIIFLKFQLNFEVVHMVIHLDFVQSDFLH